MLVVDASAVADLLLGTARSASVRVAIGDHTLHAPHLLSIEVTSVLRRLLLSGEIDEAVATRALTELDELGIEWYEHGVLLARSLELRHAVTSYDGMYVALAEALGAPLLTCDVHLARSGGGRAEFALIEG